VQSSPRSPRLPAGLARLLASPAFLLPALTYLSLALWPGCWDEASRGQLVLQFVIVEFCAGMLVDALCRLAADGSAGMLAVGRWIVLAAALAGPGLVAWVSQSLALTAMIGAPVLPRVIATLRKVQRNQAGHALCTDGILSLGGCCLIGIGYLLLHSAAPGDPPDVRSQPPPLALTATAMATHYLVLAYASGRRR
jgi:hypothetical protein